MPGDWLMAAHAVIGWPRGEHGPLPRRQLRDGVYRDHWGEEPGPLAECP